jgi:DNA-directed RNA polymerase beta subunit
VNIVAVMKAMGAESDQEVVAMVGCEESMANLLLPSVQECKTLGVFTQHQALEFLGSKLAQRGFRAGQERRRKSKVRQQQWLSQQQLVQGGGAVPKVVGGARRVLQGKGWGGPLC